MKNRNKILIYHKYLKQIFKYNKIQNYQLFIIIKLKELIIIKKISTKLNFLYYKNKVMYICNGITKNGKKCRNKIKNNNMYCWKHIQHNKINYEKMGNLPNEIYIIIYEYLDFKDKIQFSNTNKKLYIIFRNIIKNTNINILLNKDIAASYYIKKFLKNNDINISMNLNHNNYYFKGIEEVDYKLTYNKKEIIIYKKNIYENINKKINFGFETKKLKCINDEIKLINDLIERLKI